MEPVRDLEQPEEPELPGRIAVGPHLCHDGQRGVGFLIPPDRLRCNRCGAEHIMTDKQKKRVARRIGERP
jgi:hypothetical protein